MACTPSFVYLLGAIGDRESVDYVDSKPIWAMIFGSKMLEPTVVECMEINHKYQELPSYT